MKSESWILKRKYFHRRWPLGIFFLCNRERGRRRRRILDDFQSTERRNAVGGKGQTEGACVCVCQCVYVCVTLPGTPPLSPLGQKKWMTSLAGYWLCCCSQLLLRLGCSRRVAINTAARGSCYSAPSLSLALQSLFISFPVFRVLLFALKVPFFFQRIASTWIWWHQRRTSIHNDSTGFE